MMDQNLGDRAMLSARETTLRAEQDAFLSRQKSARLKRRLLPLAGVVGLIALWALLVYVLKVPPFVAPSPQHRDRQRYR